MMNFERAFAQFMEKHIEESSGLRRERLLKGLGFGEVLFLKDGWWKAFGNFDYLYPEFMVRDLFEGFRFLDFAFLRPPHLVSFDVDGYGPHYSKLDRKGFSDERDRQNLLVMDNWKVFRFSVDKLKDHKRACQSQLLQIIGCLYGEDNSNLLTPQEQLIIQKAGIYGDQFTPGQAAEWLGLSDRQARKYLQRLMEKNQIVPVSGVERIRAYKLSYDERIKGVDRK